MINAQNARKMLQNPAEFALVVPITLERTVASTMDCVTSTVTHVLDLQLWIVSGAFLTHMKTILALVFVNPLT